MKKIILSVIGFYQRFISPALPPSCRFYPTCSHYAYTAVERFGFLKGSWLAVKRISKCHPFHSGGLDPVPECNNCSK
ncbi:MAG: membrane protein insertion efficiency factor YidD [Candidatus Kapabacteria bacterium]|nr:membrane protein insertion efficiency factor YidD [Candidatus Kapabacteria bacterium]